MLINELNSKLGAHPFYVEICEFKRTSEFERVRLLRVLRKKTALIAIVLQRNGAERALLHVSHSDRLWFNLRQDPGTGEYREGKDPQYFHLKGLLDEHLDD